MYCILLAIWLPCVNKLELSWVEKFPKKYHSNRQKLPLSTTPLHLRSPPRRTPASIRIHLIFIYSPIFWSTPYYPRNA